MFSWSGHQTSSANIPAEAKEEEASCEQTEAIPPLPSTAGGFVRKRKSSSGIAGIVNPLAEADRKAKKKKAEEGKKESQHCNVRIRGHPPRR